MSLLDLPENPEDLTRWILAHGNETGIHKRIRSELREWLLHTAKNHPSMIKYDYIPHATDEETKIKIYIDGCVWGSLSSTKSMDVYRAVVKNCEMYEEDWHD